MLNLSQNKLNDNAAKSIARLILETTKLKRLFIANNKFMAAGGVLIANALA